VFVTACVELPKWLLIVDELVYVIELAALLVNRYTSAVEAAGPVPSNALPFTSVLFLIPKYTFVCEARLIPEHVTVAPEPRLGLPLTEQLPPPGSEYTGPPVMISASALVAPPSSASIPKIATRLIMAVFPPCGFTNVMRTPPPSRCGARASNFLSPRPVRTVAAV
jgi:hypothetical protein